MRENPEKDVAYVSYSGDIERLADELVSICRARHGDTCEFYSISIERTRDGNSWKVHEFSNFDDQAARAIKNHLKARTDTVRLNLGTGDDHRLEFRVCSPANSSELARYVSREEREALDESDLVVLCIEGGGVSEEQKEFLWKLESD